MDQPVRSEEFAPWAHPKAQAWFELIFERSGVIESFLTILETKAELPTMPQQRLMAAICVLLGRKGIWPAHQADAFQRIVMALLRNRRSQQTDARRPLNLTEHRQQTIFQENYEHELEALRRRVGLSKKVTRLLQPVAWGRFWY